METAEKIGEGRAAKPAKNMRGCLVWIVNLVAMLVVAVSLFFGVKWWLGYYTHHGEGIEVPDLYGMTHHRSAESGSWHEGEEWQNHLCDRQLADDAL